MTAPLLIAEVARRTGYRPTTLRYYERIGLLPTPPRTAAGYRLYDESALDRLALVTRAKQLGCTLEEIAELTSAWDSGHCADVYERLRTVVAAKRIETQRAIDELAVLAAELHRTAAVLGHTTPPDTACDDACPCTTPVGVVSPVGDAAAVCSLDAEAQVRRLADWQRVLGFVTARADVEDGLELRFAASVPLAELVMLAAAEQQCCPVFAFNLTIDDCGIALHVRADAGAAKVLDTVFGVSPNRPPANAPDGPCPACG